MSLRDYEFNSTLLLLFVLRGNLHHDKRRINELTKSPPWLINAKVYSLLHFLVVSERRETETLCKTELFEIELFGFLTVCKQITDV